MGNKCRSDYKNPHRVLSYWHKPYKTPHIDEEVNPDDYDIMISTLDPLNYTVALFAPRYPEAKAAFSLLDELHQGRFPVNPGDNYIYRAGEMCGYNDKGMLPSW